MSAVRPKLNKEWHMKHPMPEKPTLEQRIEWHIAHAAHCACRDIPANLLHIIEKRKKHRHGGT